MIYNAEIIEENELANRLSKIYTKTGDQGTTGLGDGSRVAKNSLRVQAMGDVDELNAVIGMLQIEALSGEISTALARIQHDLFDLGGELCLPGQSLVKANSVSALELQMDAWNEHLPPLKEFILPGGCRAAAVCHLARTVCRRAERCMHALHAEEALGEIALQYINRLSDFLFVLCRQLNVEAGVSDVLWNNTYQK